MRAGMAMHASTVTHLTTAMTIRSDMANMPNTGHGLMAAVMLCVAYGPAEAGGRERSEFATERRGADLA